MTKNPAYRNVRMDDNDLRVAVPLYTFAEAARIADLSPHTVANWASPSRGTPLVESFESKERGYPRLSFMSLTIVLVIAELKKAGVPMRLIKPALAKVEEEFGIKYAVAHKMLLTDGYEVLLEAPHDAISKDIFLPRTGQTVMREIQEAHLHVIEHAKDGYPARLKLSKYAIAEVVVDPEMSFGSPFFRYGGVTVDRVLSRLRAGESEEKVSKDFGVPLEHVKDVRSASIKLAA